MSEFLEEEEEDIFIIRRGEHNEKEGERIGKRKRNGSGDMEIMDLLSNQFE